MATTEKPFVQKKDIPHTIVGMVLRGVGLGLVLMGILVLALGHDISPNNPFLIVEAILCFGIGMGLHGIHTMIYLLIDIKDPLQDNKNN